jgi:hypothetical protein
MNKLQKYLILSGRRVIGTPSGQAFVERSAKKYADLLTEKHKPQSFQVVPITSVRELLEGK